MSDIILVIVMLLACSVAKSESEWSWHYKFDYAMAHSIEEHPYVDRCSCSDRIHHYTSYIDFTYCTTAIVFKTAEWERKTDMLTELCYYLGCQYDIWNITRAVTEKKEKWFIIYEKYECAKAGDK